MVGVKTTPGRLGEKTMQSSVLEVIVMHSTWLRGKMTLGRRGEKPLVSEVMVEQSTVFVVMMTPARLREKMTLGGLDKLTTT